MNNRTLQNDTYSRCHCRSDQKITNLRKAGPKSRMTKREAGRMTKQAAALPLYAPHSMAAPPAAEKATAAAA